MRLFYLSPPFDVSTCFGYDRVAIIFTPKTILPSAMNKYILFLLLLLPLLSFAQKTTIENGKLNGILPVNEQGKVTYQVVESVNGASQAELFQRARRWFTQTYKSPNTTLQINDSSTGELSGNGIFVIQPTMLGLPQNCQIDHTVSIETKDNRYRVTVNGFYLHVKTIEGPFEGIRGTTKGFVNKIFEDSDRQVYNLLASLKKEMTSKKADF